VKDELTDDGHPKASGDTIEAIVNRLLDFMYSEWKKAQASEKANPPTQGQSKKQKVSRDATSPESTPSEDEIEIDDDVVIECPPEWIFRGFMAFMFFGPFHENREAGRYIDLLFLENPPKKDAKKLSRKTQREEKQRTGLDLIK